MANDRRSGGDESQHRTPTTNEEGHAMRYTMLGRSGISISSIVAGGWQAGREDWIDIDDDESVAAFRAAFDAGVTTFDTAEEYGNGHSERILVRALGNHRDEIVIATKVSWRHLSARSLVEACERSLVNLHTDRIDLYQIHWPAGSFGSEKVPLEETVEALTKLQQAGKIRSVGVSNFDGPRLAEAATMTRIDAVQVPYSLFWRRIEADVLPVARSADMTVMAYSPLAQGLLTGAIDTDRVFPPDDNRSDNKLFRADHRRRAHAAVVQLQQIAGHQGVTTAQLALSWLLARPNVVAVVGARNPAQARENAAAGSVVVAPPALDKADRICRTVTDPLDGEQIMWDWPVDGGT
jgi:myo-inositol catabolism protein IolS